MKHAWGLLLLIGCGGTSGEPMMGDVMFTYGTGHPKMAYGAAVQNKDTPTEMVVQIGDDNVDCSTYLDQFTIGGPEGTFVYFSIDASASGPVANQDISVQKTSGTHTSINESTGMVTIDTSTPRVTGSLTFMTTDDQVGPISVMGNFDVKRCF